MEVFVKLAIWVILNAFYCPLLIFFQNYFFAKSYYRNTIRVSNSLGPDQVRQFVGLNWVQTVCNGYQQTTLGDKSKWHCKVI